MGKKRKRSQSKDSEYDSIRKKVKRLEQKLKRRERRISSSSSSRSNDVNVENVLEVDVHHSESVQSPLRDMDFEESGTCQNDTVVMNDETNNEDNETGLNPDILKILGDDPANKNSFDENLHKDITPRWQHILVNGLSKEGKAELMQLYMTPENCKNLKAPKLNLEIKAALSETNLKKDNFSENKQNQLSSGIAAVGKALNVALSYDASLSQDLIKYLSDAGRLLCDYHYRESQSRRYAIINTLNKQTRDTVKNTKLDDYLFGSELAEHLKSSKAIEKSGSELKSMYAVPRRPQQKAAPTVPPQRGALNFRGAPRTAAPETRPYAAARRPVPAPTVKDRRHDPTSRSTYYQRGRKR